MLQTGEPDVTSLLSDVRASEKRLRQQSLRARTRAEHKERGGPVKAPSAEARAGTGTADAAPEFLHSTEQPSSISEDIKSISAQAPEVEPAELIKGAAFKRWFGDWESEPQKASAARDEEGQPRAYFHGMRGALEDDAFDPKRAAVAHVGKGFYFAENPQISDHFANLNGGQGGNVTPAYLSIKRPLDFDQNVSQEEIARWKANLKDLYQGDEQAKQLEHYLKGGSSQRDLLSQLSDFVRGLFRSSKEPTGYDAWHALANTVGGPRNVNDVLAKFGYDGIQHTATGVQGGVRPPKSDAPSIGKVFVAFAPSQVKSATANEGTFDPNDPRIHKEGGGEVPSISALTKDETASTPAIAPAPQTRPQAPSTSRIKRAWNTVQPAWTTGKTTGGLVSTLLDVPGVDVSQIGAGLLSALVGLNQGASAMPATAYLKKDIAPISVAAKAADAFSQLRRREYENPEPAVSRDPPIHREQGGMVPSTTVPRQAGGEVPEVPGIPREADEVPIKAKAGEVVVKNGPAQIYRQQLEAMNNDQVPHFEQGGEVGAERQPSQPRREASDQERAVLRMQREAEENAARFEKKGLPAGAAWHRKQAELHAAEVARIRALPVAEVAPAQPSEPRRPADDASAPNQSTLAPPTALAADAAPSAEATPDAQPSQPTSTPGADAAQPGAPAKREFDVQAWRENRARTAANTASPSTLSDASKASTADAVESQSSAGHPSAFSWAPVRLSEPTAAYSQGLGL